MSLPAELLSSREAGDYISHRQTYMEDVLVEHAEVRIAESGEYRPDVSNLYTMTYIQQELGRRGINTTLTPLFFPGETNPASFKIRQTDTEDTNLAEVYTLDNYRDSH